MRAVAAFTLLLVCACSGKPAAPYVREHVDGDASKPCLAWPKRSLTYAVDPAGSARTAGDTELAAIDAAFAAWNAAAATCSDLTFTKDVASANLVVWREKTCASVVPAGDACLTDGTCDTKYACWDDVEDTLAITTVTYSRSLGTLLDADIQLNGAAWLYTTVDSPPCAMGMPLETCVATDVQNTVTHEIGHLLGFGHTDGKSSTMAAFAPLGDLTKRVIDDGTRDGLCAVYPRGAQAPACP
ncbi:MAG: matrixin [Myxococcaceae bacterium]|nr:matrixin [Myxococcaceae bacterium]